MRFAAGDDVTGPESRVDPQRQLAGGAGAADNAPWFTAGALAHNLWRWTTRLGFKTGLITAKTFRRQLLTLPGPKRVTARPTGEKG